MAFKRVNSSLTEKKSESFFHLAGFHDFNLEAVVTYALGVAFRNNNGVETEFVGFAYALLNASHLTQLAGKSHLAAYAHARIYCHIYV